MECKMSLVRALDIGFPYVTVYKSKEKFRAHKIITGGPSAPGL